MENKYIVQANKGKVGPFYYLAGIALIVLGYVLFIMPLRSAVVEKIDAGLADISKIKDTSYVLSLFDSNLGLLFITLPFLGGLLFLFFSVVKIHKLSLKFLTTSRSKIDFKRVFFSFGLWGGVNVVLILLSVYMSPDTIVWNFNAEKFAILFVIAMVMIPIQTSLEEYVFRGYLMQGLGVASKTNWFPLLITSVMFGLMHFGNPEVGKLGYGIMTFYIGTGFLLGITTLMDEGMELSLGFHAAHNLMTALLVTTDWTAFQTYAVFKDTSEPSLSMELGVMLVLYPLLLIVFAKKYNWQHWKEKLI
ncbi:CPBP family intramembrane glutamic endopeptidase [Wenyingzhuangia sp. IMCC45574]